MKAMLKQELADRAGVSVNTLNRWCKPFQKELEAMGLQRKTKMLPPVAVKFLAEKLCIDV
jgi:transposase